MSDDLRHHPIQLISIDVKEISIISLANSLEEKKEFSEEGVGNIMVGASDFDSEQNRIAVGLKFLVNEENDKKEIPYSLKIELQGIFEVDESEVRKAEEIENWAYHNALYILFPYLREHAYSITQRAGFNPSVLPLIEIPNENSSEEE